MLAWAAAMGRTSRRTAVLAAFAVALLAPAAGAPPVAHAGPYEDVFADFQSDGKIEACDHSEADLRRAKRDIPNDIDDYAKDFPGELDAAIEERADGGCEDKGEATGGTPAGEPPTATTGTPPATTPVPAVPQAGTPQPPGTSGPAPPAADGAIERAAQREADEGGGVPAPLVALAALAILLALVLAVWGVARALAWEPRWLPGARHAIAEAGWRTGGAWSDFADWIRSRRAA